ncbi:MAG: glycosyltransferase family 4 protein [Chlorogloeopsis fritschii C42_A2020_084]|uniref:glycosyltransferase family 4 protein n=1 Tax=Chlorogloeopsis fritschii TaxID=1124 RepID=UPI0019DA65A7|nr:glycosyltransferase family 4 protein [Chlorogloeopsis fritschii]MBF2005406.1 glycosyltransferase family 4 protein [Chlorogloeopsis fritschii C42_A2020_084]
MLDNKSKVVEVKQTYGNNPIQVIMLGPSLSVNGGISSVEKLILQYAPPEIKIRHITTHEEGSIKRRILVFGKALIQLVWTLLTEDIDIFHIHLSQRGSAFRKAILSLLIWLFRKPVILHAHGSEFRLFYANLNPIIKKLLGWVLFRCSRLIVLSESWKSFYTTNLGLTAKQVIVLPNPVQLPAQIPSRLETHQVKFLFLGRIGQRKGAFDLIKAFAMLSAEQKSCSSLILAGDGDLEQASQLIKNLNLTNQITLPGWVNTEQRDALLAKANVFVLPSYNEGLPMALLEAMGWGLPVITTPVGGIPEVVNSSENGLLINPGDIRQLSEAMKSLIENRNLRLDLGNNARKSVASLDVKNYGFSLLNIFRELQKESVYLLKK